MPSTSDSPIACTTTSICSSWARPPEACSRCRRVTRPPALPRTTHFGFRADGPDFVHAARAAFRAAEVEEAEWQESGPTRVQVFDPDGYRVGIYAFSWRISRC